MKSTLIKGMLTVLILLAGRVAWFTEPYGISVDESTYLSISQRMLVGGTLYVDAVDRKPPGLFWLYEAIQRVFGPWNIHGVHIAFLGLTLILCLLLKYSSRTWGLALLFAAYSVCLPREVFSSNSEIVMMAPLGLAVVFLIREAVRNRSNWQALWVMGGCTLLAALSTLCKQIGGLIYAAVYLAWMGVYFTKNSGSWREKIQFQLGCALASICSLALVYGSTYFYFSDRGAASEFVTYFLWDGLSYVAQDAARLNQENSAWKVVLGVAAAWLPLTVASIYRLRMRWSIESSLIFAGFIGAWMTVFLSGRYYTHYFVPVIWFLCWWSWPALEEMFYRLGSTRKRVGFVSFLLLPFVVFAVFNPNQERFHSGWSFNKKKLSEMAEVADWVQNQTLPAEQIMVWGMASQFYVLARRGSATRFVFSDFASGRLPGFKSAVSIPTPGAMEQLLADIETRRPVIIIDTNPAKLNDYGHFPLSRFPDLHRLVENNYERVHSLHGFDLWQIKRQFRR